MSVSNGSTYDVVVFGGAGFAGSHAADALSNAGHRVTIFDRIASSYVRPDQEMVVGNVLDARLVDETIANSDVVYNFAGIADLGESRERPLDTIQFNIMGNGIVLEACRKHGVQRYVFASSIYVYSQKGGFYRCSKQACELYIEEYNRLHDLDYTILRFGSLYGRRADARNAVHRFLNEALVDRKIVYYGEGNEIREYIHVEDAAKSCVEILSAEFKNQHVVLSGTQSLRVRDLLSIIGEMVGEDVEVDFRTPEPGGIRMGEYGRYSQTPYSFQPKVAKRLVRHSYLDLGQGLLDCLHAIHDQRTAEVSELRDQAALRFRSG